MESLHRRSQLMALTGLLLTTFTAGAQNPPIANLSAFGGTWKEDPAKTVRKPDGEIRKYAQNADGTMSVSIGETYHDVFRIDGKPYPVMPRPDVQQTWTQTGPSSWESINTKDGQVEETIRRTVSSDGKTLTHMTMGKTKSGQPITTTVVYERSSAEKSGLVGTWKPVSLHVDPPAVITLQIKSDGALSFSGTYVSFVIIPDGEKHTLEGDVGVVSLRASDDHKMEFTFFSKGKPVESSTLTLSADGRILTEIERDPANSQELGTLIYQKQK